MASNLAIGFLFLITALELVAGDDWSYEVQNWKTIHPQCNGNAQSPINIDTNTVSISKYQSLWIYGSDVYYNWTSTNNGHTLKIAFANGPSRTYLAEDRPIILGSTLGSSRYIMEQLHFHWTENDKSGSEHSINGRKFAGELHLVFYNSKYPDFNAALSHSDGLTVIAVFLEVLPGIYGNIPVWNYPLMQIIDTIANVKKPMTSTPIYRMRLDELIPYTELFYRYKGSLTTPPCSQNVEFIIFGKPIPISKPQMDSFRKLNEISPEGKEEPLLSNVRVLQPRNGRTVIASTFIPKRNSLNPDFIDNTIDGIEE